MNYKQTKETLDTLHTSLEKQYQSALKDINARKFKEASITLTEALGEADREVTRAKREENLTEVGLVQEDISEEAVKDAYQRVALKVQELQVQKGVCDKFYSIEQFDEEQHDALERKNSVDEKRRVALQYERSYMQLDALKKQPEPYVGVKDELTLFLKQVKQVQADKSVSMPELTQIMNATYDRLTGGSKEKFDSMVNSLNAKHSIPLKLLGASLILLGAALVAAAIMFAPAIITAASTSLATAYLLTAGATTASAALVSGGTATFFAKTDKMKLAEAGKDLNTQDLEQKHYAPVMPN